MRGEGWAWPGASKKAHYFVGGPLALPKMALHRQVHPGADSVLQGREEAARPGEPPMNWSPKRRAVELLKDAIREAKSEERRELDEEESPDPGYWREHERILRVALKAVNAIKENRR